jgi:hypothetical protein
MVVKALGLPEITEQGLFCEIYGNILARELGVITPEPALVELSREIADLVNPYLAEQGVRVHAGIAVASEYLEGGLATVVPVPFQSEREIAQAARIYGFDLLTQNPDRRPKKPNCAFNGRDLIAYDFELAFSFLLTLTCPEQPWEVSKHGIASQHLFYAALRKVRVDWQDVVSSLDGLTAERLDYLIQGLPDGWLRWADRIHEHILAVVAHKSEFELEILRSLA